MAQRHMGNFMSHHARKLRFVVRHLNGSAIDENISARQRERIDGLVVYAMEFEGILHSIRRQLGDEPHSQLRKISIDFGVIAKWQLFPSIRGRSLADFDVLLRSEHVPSGFQGGTLGRGKWRE